MHRNGFVTVFRESVNGRERDEVEVKKRIKEVYDKINENIKC